MTGLLAAGRFRLARATGGIRVPAAGRFPPPCARRLRSLLDVALRVGGPVLPPIAAVLPAPGREAATKGVPVPALLGAAGWLVTYLQELDARDRDRIDMMQVLRAEAGVILRVQQGRDPMALARRAQAGIAAAPAAREDCQPFFPMPPTPVVSDALADGVERLPSAVAARVIQFSALLADVRRLAEDMRSDGFQRLPMQRRRRAHARDFQRPGTLRALAAAIRETAVDAGVAEAAPGLDHEMPAAAGEPVNRPGRAPVRREAARDVSVAAP